MTQPETPADLADVRKRLEEVIVAANELAKDFAALSVAKQLAEVARESLARRHAVRWQVLLEANHIIGYALHLRQHGENAPGGNETWQAFDRRAEEYLRVHATSEPPGFTQVWQPGGDALNLHQVVTSALASAEDPSSRPAVYEGLMAWLSDWADDIRRQANEATAAKMREAEKW